MKTLKLACIALLAMGLNVITVNAQSTKKDKGATKTTTQKSDAGAKTNASGQHLKKDGTPDMRYKENKDAAKSASSSGTTTSKSSGSKGKSGSKGAKK